MTTKKVSSTLNKKIAQLCDDCPNKERCCSFYTDVALTCVCECGQYLPLWQSPSRVGTRQCEDCVSQEAQ